MNERMIDMARVKGIRERREKSWYDTHVLEAGQTLAFFGKDAVVGDLFRTNMHAVGNLPPSYGYIILGIGARLIGKSRDQEDLLLDHLHFTIVVGDRPIFDAIGPHLSMLRHYYTEEEMLRMKAYLDAEGTRAIRPCYILARPIVIPTGQNFCVRVQAAPTLPEAVKLRTYLFGLMTWDMP
jgi:hypothetical protein